jgi:hypothetical protein
MLPTYANYRVMKWLTYFSDNKEEKVMWSLKIDVLILFIKIKTTAHWLMILLSNTLLLVTGVSYFRSWPTPATLNLTLTSSHGTCTIVQKFYPRHASKVNIMECVTVWGICVKFCGYMQKWLAYQMIARSRVHLPLWRSKFVFGKKTTVILSGLPFEIVIKFQNFNMDFGACWCQKQCSFNGADHSLTIKSKMAASNRK